MPGQQPTSRHYRTAERRCALSIPRAPSHPARRSFSIMATAFWAEVGSKKVCAKALAAGRHALAAKAGRSAGPEAGAGHAPGSCQRNPAPRPEEVKRICTYGFVEQNPLLASQLKNAPHRKLLAVNPGVSF